MSTSVPETALLEGMTAISAVLDPAVRAFNDRQVLEVYADRERAQRKPRELAFLRARGRELGFPVTLVGADELDAMTAGKTHGGFAARCSGRTIPELEACPDAIRRDGFYVLPEGIEDPYNFAYTLRSLYAAGADGAILPPRNWMSAAGIVAKSSAGTSEKLPLFSCDPPRAAELFRSWGFRVICAGIRDSVDLYEADLRLPLLLVIGGEKRGISRGVLEHADLTVRIRYSDRHGFRGSLPSAASAAVLAFEVMRQNR